MKLKAIVPSVPEIGREALIVIGGALLAAFIVSQWPAVKTYINDSWGNTPRPF